MLPRHVTGPIRDVELERAKARRLLRGLDDFGNEQELELEEKGSSHRHIAVPAMGRRNRDSPVPPKSPAGFPAGSRGRAAISRFSRSKDAERRAAPASRARARAACLRKASPPSPCRRRDPPRASWWCSRPPSAS